MGHVVVFAPSPILSVTVEEQNGDPEIHVHAGGQGMWQARMLRSLDIDVTMCSVVSGETGNLLRHLIDQEGIELLAVEGRADNGAYVHDRRGGDRVTVAESGGECISRHDLDELYGITLRAGMDAGTVILSGATREHIVPVELYRRLASDLNTVGCQVIADQPTLLLSDGELSEITMPTLEVVDTHGGGDSLTAGVAAAVAEGAGIKDAVTLGAAAGSLNVTRHGLGSGNRETVHKLQQLVTVRAMDQKGDR